MTNKVSGELLLKSVAIEEETTEIVLLMEFRIYLGTCLGYLSCSTR